MPVSKIKENKIFNPYLLHYLTIFRVYKCINVTETSPCQVNSSKPLPFFIETAFLAICTSRLGSLYTGIYAC